MTDAIIRATARIQEANEPTRQRPVIKFDPRQQRPDDLTIMANSHHMNDANQLANSIRASIDSGKDNPFRPDGEIYKLTNPIVDYYKHGPNQSRSGTPSFATESELMQDERGKNKKNKNGKYKTKNKNQLHHGPTSHNDYGNSNDANTDDLKPVCWRRWLCCCCCFCCPGNNTNNKNKESNKNVTTDSSHQRISSNINDVNDATSPLTMGAAITPNSNKKTSNDLRAISSSRGDNLDDSGDVDSGQQRKSNLLLMSGTNNNSKRQAKVVLVDDRDGDVTWEGVDGVESKKKDKKKTKNAQKKKAPRKDHTTDQSTPNNGHHDGNIETPVATQAKTSRCVIS